MKVILIKQGLHEDLGSQGDPELFDEIPEICGAIVLLKGEKNIIVDTGNLGYEKEIINSLKKEGLTPDDIDYVINTHGHNDHISNNYLFKKAIRVGLKTFWFPDKSFKMFKKPVKFSGIEIIDTKGHTDPHRSVIVKSEGKTYVIAGDAIQKFILDNPLGIKFNSDYVDSAKKIFKKNPDIIIPGHGPIIEGERLEKFRQTVEKLGGI